MDDQGLLGPAFKQKAPNAENVSEQAPVETQELLGRLLGQKVKKIRKMIMKKFLAK